MNESPAGLNTVARAITALLLTSSLLFSGAASPPPASADDVVVRDHRDKDAWLEVVIHKIIIHDDRDWGQGEFHFQVRVGSLSCPEPEFVIRFVDCFHEQVKSDGISFNANDGNVKTIGRVVPRMGDILSTSLIADAGITVHPNTKYGIEISGVEVDPAFDDEMGWTNFVLSNDADWGVGTHTMRGLVGHSLNDILNDVSCENIIVCSSDFGWMPAYYSVEFEVRKTALADLTPKSLKVVDRDPPKPNEPRYKEICLTVSNIGPKPALGYDVNFLIDNTPIKASAGAAYPGDLDEVCTRIADPSVGEHQLDAVIAGVPEMDLSNNEMKSTYVRRLIDDIRAPLDSSGVLSSVDGPSTSPSDTGQTGPTIVNKEQSAPNTSMDLAVTAIQVKNKSGNGKSDCDPGKNDVTVTVKNQGDSKVSNRQVSLTVDDHDAKDKPIPNLDAGRDATVTFSDVQLDKGERKLTASVSPKDGGNDDSPELKKTVSCQAE